MYQSEQYLDIPSTDILSWTFGNTSYDQDKPIYVDAHDANTRISYREAKSYVKKLIGGLYARGIRPGDSVSVHAFNNVYYSLAWLAIIGVGGRFVGSNPSYTRFELSHLYSLTNTKLILVEPGLLENVIHAAQDCCISLSKIFAWDAHGEDIPPGFDSWRILLDYGERNWNTFENEEQSKTTIAALMSTSGTTGLPKAAAVSHHAQITQNITIKYTVEKPYEAIRLLCLPLFHAFAGPMAHMSPLRDGYTTYIMKRYDQQHFVEYIDRFQVTDTLVVTPIVQGLLTQPQSCFDKLNSLRYVWTAGAPLDSTHQDDFNQRLHADAIFTQIWGLTEMGWITGFKYPEKDAGSVGRLMPNTEAMIIDKEGREASGEGESGEILIRGPALMTEYFGAPEATAKTIVNGWLHTGDIGYQKAGKWYIIDRAKELIKVRGWQVSPTEIENCLLQHPLISDAAVIGVGYPDVQVEMPRAYVVMDSKSTTAPPSDKDIHDHVMTHLAKYKSLSGGIRRVDTIPRSAAGKILKKVLREAAAQEAIEQANLKHFEQPVPVDKNYFEHVEHVEPAKHVTTDKVVTRNGIVSGRERKKQAGIKNGVNGTGTYVLGASDHRKRKHELSSAGRGRVSNHKRTKSHPNGVGDQVSKPIENGRRRSTRINGRST